MSRYDNFFVIENAGFIHQGCRPVSAREPACMLLYHGHCPDWDKTAGPVCLRCTLSNNQNMAAQTRMPTHYKMVRFNILSFLSILILLVFCNTFIPFLCVIFIFLGVVLARLLVTTPQ